MKNVFIALFLSAFVASYSQTVKSKALKLKYTTLEGWTAVEFGSPTSWEESGNAMCKCSGVSFTKPKKDGKMNVVVYPSSPSGLDSAKRNFVGNLQFVDVEKYEKTTNKHFSFQKKRSSFTDMKTGKKAYETIRYFTNKIEDHYYIIYVWQENSNLLNSTIEKEFTEMVNAIEPL